MSDEWIKRMWYIYTMAYYSAIKKKKEILAFTATWIDLEIIILSEISQKEKDKYHMTSLIGKILKDNMSESELGLERKQTYGPKEERGRGIT